MRKNLRPIASLLVGVALLLAGNGLQFTLLPLRGSADGFGAVALGPADREVLSIEANGDVLAAACGYSLLCGSPAEAEHYRQAAKEIAEWIVEKMWLGDHFGIGSTVPDGKPLLRRQDRVRSPSCPPRSHRTGER